MTARKIKPNPANKPWCNVLDDPVGNKTAMINDIEVSVDVDKYPVYYLVHRKNEKDGEPVAMVIVPSEEEDVGYPMTVAVFMRKNYTMKRITKAEAETWEVFEVASIMSPKEFGQWLAEESEEIEKSFGVTGIKERNGIVKKGSAVFDLNSRITKDELNPKSRG